MIVVADAGPPHYLVLIEAVDVLESLYSCVLVPQAVAGELQETNTPAVVRAWIAKPPAWCEICTDPPSDPARQFLHAGEHAAITLALSVGADRLLIDEQAGRAEAERRHLLVTGTLGVLAEAHRAGMLDFETALSRLRQTNFYISDKVVDRARQQLSTGKGRDLIGGHGIVPHEADHRLRE
jgi:predicted nucleic acid-binding protein